MNPTADLGMLKLTLNPRRDSDYFRLVVEQVQQVTGVVRVRADQATAQVEIVFRQPAVGLLRSIHEALRLAGAAVVAGKSY